VAQIRYRCISTVYVIHIAQGGVDADAEHARYLQRHPEKASVTQAA
jgi:hypothetical protein